MSLFVILPYLILNLKVSKKPWGYTAYTASQCKFFFGFKFNLWLNTFASFFSKSTLIVFKAKYNIGQHEFLEKFAWHPTKSMIRFYIFLDKFYLIMITIYITINISFNVRHNYCYVPPVATTHLVSRQNDYKSLSDY